MTKRWLLEILDAANHSTLGNHANSQRPPKIDDVKVDHHLNLAPFHGDVARIPEYTLKFLEHSDRVFPFQLVDITQVEGSSDSYLRQPVSIFT